jgi:5-methyltetrahydropteroyltriglutamate--homocysteine methyltransferase
MPKPILLPTSLVGSYPQPDWLIDRDELVKSVVRLRAEHLWLIDRDHREAAQDDATILAVRDQERAGLDIVSDGEQARESYSNHFATALDGVDLDKPGQTPNRFGKMIPVPRIAGKIKRKHPVEVHAVKLVRANTDRMVKATVPGAFTMAVQAQDDFYKDPEALANDYAVAVNEEIKDLFAAGADIVQLDEPWMVSFADRARKFGISILDRAIATIILGVLNLGDMAVETPETVAARIRAALKYVPAQRLVIAPDCGMKYLPRAVAFGKMQAMVAGTSIVRKELN